MCITLAYFYLIYNSHKCILSKYPQLKSSNHFFATSNTLYCVCQGASQKSQFPQTSRTDCVSHFLHLVHFLCGFSVWDTARQAVLEQDLSYYQIASWLRHNLGCPAVMTTWTFQTLSEQEKAKQKPYTKEKNNPKQSKKSPFPDDTEKKQPRLHSLKDDSALAIYRVVEWKWCSDHKRHKTLCAQQFARFLPTILVSVMQVLFPQARFILCN